MPDDAQSESTRRRRLLQLALAGALAPTLASQKVLAMSRTVDQGLQRVRGDVRINGQPAKIGDLVRLGDRVSTGAGSSAVLVMDRDAFLLRANSEVEFGGDNGVVRLLRTLSGRILSVFQPGKADRRFETGVATIGVRGTGIYIEEQPQRTYVCTCYGTAELTPRAAPAQREQVVTRHHESPRYIYGGGRTTLSEQAPVLNHTDAELFMLESLVRREPPFDPAAY